jgi:hypothetical protein
MIQKKAQFKIQEMAFVLVAVIVLFGIIFLFFARFELTNVTKTSNELREERAITLVRTVASMPELRCSERVSESVCLDLDKIKAFNSSSSLRLNYKKIWTSSYVTEVAVQNVFDTRQTYYIYQENHGNESYFSFMPLCSEDNCTIARLIIGIRTEK